MAINVVFAGEVYSIAERNDRNWSELTEYLVAISNNALTAENFTQNIRVDTGAEVVILTTDSIVIVDNVNDIEINLPSVANENKIVSIFDTANAIRDITISNISETFVSNNNAIQLAYKDGEWQIISNISQIDANITVLVNDLKTIVENIALPDLANRYAIYQRNSLGELVNTYQTEAIRLPAGTTAERPTPQVGLFRYNTTTGKPEFYNSVEWKVITTADVAGASLNDLNDVAIDNISLIPNQALVWNGSAWVNQLVASNLADLLDVNLNTPLENQALVYKSGEWVNSTTSLELNYVTDSNFVSEPNNNYIIDSFLSTVTLHDADDGDTIQLNARKGTVKVIGSVNNEENFTLHRDDAYTLIYSSALNTWTIR